MIGCGISVQISLMYPYVKKKIIEITVPSVNDEIIRNFRIFLLSYIPFPV